MRAHEVDRLFSRALMLGWAIPAVLILLPLFSFNVLDRFWMCIAVLTVLTGIWLCRVAEVPTGNQKLAPQAPALPSPRQCRRAVYLLSVLALFGAVLTIVDKQGALGGFDITNLQQRYIDIMVASGDGAPIGTWLSTVGNVLRSLVYVAIVAMVALSRQSPGIVRTALPWIAVLAAVAASEIATASRSYLVFCVIVGLFAGFAVGHRVIRRLGTLIALGSIAVVLFSITTIQRLEVMGTDSDFAIELFSNFFDVHLGWLGHWTAENLGFPVITGLLYLSHPLPEFSRLVADGSSQVALGGHSLYLVFSPIERLFGAEAGLAPNALAQRPGMWWGMLGDLYLDFGVAFVVAYPAVLAGMTRIALWLRGPDVFSLTVRCLTGAMFFSSPFFGVLNTYSFAYLFLLAIAALNLRLRHKRGTSVSTHTPVSA